MSEPRRRVSPDPSTVPPWTPAEGLYLVTGPDFPPAAFTSLLGAHEYIDVAQECAQLLGGRRSWAVIEAIACNPAEPIHAGVVRRHEPEVRHGDA